RFAGSPSALPGTVQLTDPTVSNVPYLPGGGSDGTPLDDLLDGLEPPIVPWDLPEVFPNMTVLPAPDLADTSTSANAPVTGAADAPDPTLQAFLAAAVDGVFASAAGSAFSASLASGPRLSPPEAGSTPPSIPTVTAN